MVAAGQRVRGNGGMQEKIRVLLAISNFEFGGAQRQLVELANKLSDDFEVFVCTLSDYVPLRKYLRLSDDRFLVIQKRWKYDITVPIRLAKEARRLNIDVIHGFLFDAEIATRVGGWLARTPAVIGSERNSDYHIKAVQKLVYRLTKGLQHHCIANSGRGAEFNSEALRYPMTHYSVVLNGVDTERFTPGRVHAVREELGFADNEYVIGMFASFKEQKNHPMLMRALNKLKDGGIRFRMLFVGEELYGGAQDTATYYERMIELGKQLGIHEHCSYLGNVQDVQDYYKACDVTVLPSRFEGTPNVVLESLACGVPAIVTRVSSNQEIIDDGRNGYLIELDDVDALRQHLAELSQNAALLEQLGKGARKTAVQKFSTTMLAQNTADVYRRVFRKRTGRIT